MVLDSFPNSIAIKALADGIHLLANDVDGNLCWLRLTKEQLATTAPSRAGPVGKSLAPGTLSLEHAREHVRSFLGEFQTFLSNQAHSIYRANLLNRLFYERDLGAALDRDVLKMLTLLPDSLLTHLGVDLIEALRGVVQNRSLERLRLFFSLADPAGTRIDGVQSAIAFFVRWIRLYEALESKRDGLDSFFQLMSTDILKLLAQKETVARRSRHRSERPALSALSARRDRRAFAKPDGRPAAELDGIEGREAEQVVQAVSFGTRERRVRRHAKGAERHSRIEPLAAAGRQNHRRR